MLVPLSQVAARQDLVSPAPPSPTSSLTSEHTDNDDDDDGRGGGDDGNLTSDPSEAVRLLHQQLDELKEAPREQSKRRRSRRLQKKEVSSNLPSAGPPVTLAAPRTPGKRRGHHAHHHLGRRGRGRGDPPTDSQVSDSQQLQVTYDDPEGRRERAKILARIERSDLEKGCVPWHVCLCVCLHVLVC